MLRRWTTAADTGGYRLNFLVSHSRVGSCETTGEIFTKPRKSALADSPREALSLQSLHLCDESPKRRASEPQRDSATSAVVSPQAACLRRFQSFEISRGERSTAWRVAGRAASRPEAHCAPSSLRSVPTACGDLSLEGSRRRPSTRQGSCALLLSTSTHTARCPPKARVSRSRGFQESPGALSTKLAERAIVASLRAAPSQRSSRLSVKSIAAERS